MKTTFAFLTHPVNLRQVKTLWPLTRFLPASFIKSFLKDQSFKVVPLKSLKDKQGNEIEGHVIISPILPEDIQKQEDEVIFNKIIEAGWLSRELGCKILGLGGYYAAIADRKSMLYKHMKVPVTTGSAFTAWCVYEGAFKAAKKNKLELKQQTVTILSPLNSVGLLCARKFAESVSRIILSGDSAEKLEKMRQIIQAGTPASVEVENDLTRAVQQSSIIVNADPLNMLFDLTRIRPTSIVCDISIFENFREMAKERRPDIIAIDSKLVSTPFNGQMGFYLDFPRHTVSPSLAETIMLSFMQNFVNYSLGDNVNPDKVEHIADIASRHGFEVLLPGAEIL
jgi:fatty aldehyde-generating acyl-ACP reductase